MATTSSSTLTPKQRRLLTLMSSLNFARIEQLQVRGGQPVFDPPPRIYRDLKFGGDNGSRPEAARDNYLLKDRVVEFLSELEGIGDGTIACLVVRDGLPFTMSVEMVAA
jgi:hypothetical protein